MRPVVVIACIALTLFAADPAAVQATACGPDCVGLYFDLLHGRTTCLPGVPSGYADVYMILTDPTMDALSFMSVVVTTDGPIVVTGVDFGSDQICEPIEPGASCHVWSTPLPTEGETVLARIAVFYSGGGAPAFLGLRNAGEPVDDRPWVTLPNGLQVPLNPSAGPGEPMAQMGSDCLIVPAAARSWGAVKSLFR